MENLINEITVGESLRSTFVEQNHLENNIISSDSSNITIQKNDSKIISKLTFPSEILNINSQQKEMKNSYPTEACKVEYSINENILSPQWKIQLSNELGQVSGDICDSLKSSLASEFDYNNGSPKI